MDVIYRKLVNGAMSLDEVNLTELTLAATQNPLNLLTFRLIVELFNNNSQFLSREVDSEFGDITIFNWVCLYMPGLALNVADICGIINHSLITLMVDQVFIDTDYQPYVDMITRLVTSRPELLNTVDANRATPTSYLEEIIERNPELDEQPHIHHLRVLLGGNKPLI